MKILVRSAYGYDGDAVSNETGLMCLDDSLTVQADAEDADINVLVKRFGVTGEMPVNVSMPLQAEFLEARSFHESMNLIREAEDAFMEMPAEVRSRFGHDAGNLVDFASKAENLEEARKLGLAIPAPEDPAPLLVKVVPEAAKPV